MGFYRFRVFMLFFAVLLTLSCNTTSLYNPVGQLADHSFSAPSEAAVIRGTVSFEQDSENTGTGITCSGSLFARREVMRVKTFFDISQEYVWEGRVGVSGKMHDLVIRFKSSGDRDGLHKSQLFYGAVSAGDVRFSVEYLADNHRGFVFPVKVAAFESRGAEYAVFAVYENQWKSKKTNSNGEYEHRAKTARVNDLLSSAQKYQILRNGVLAAEFSGNSWTIFLSASPAERQSIETGIGIIYTVIYVNNLFARPGWPLGLD